jgi:VCBS repeat-containing protein
VTAVNDAPVLTPISDQSVDEGVQLSFIASAVDADLPENVLTFSLDPDAPAGASIDPETGVFSWVPSEADGPGLYPIKVRVTDDGVPALSDFDTFLVTVNEVNFAPVAAFDFIDTPEDVERRVLVSHFSSNDFDADGDVLTVMVFEGATDNGTVVLNFSSEGNFIRYMPNPNFHGTDFFGYTVADGHGGEDFGRVTVTVNAVNDAPVITSSPVTTATEDAAYAFDVDATDPDAGDTLTYSLDLAPAGMTIDATGLISWTPDNAQVGDHGVTVRVTDADDAVATQTFTVSVANENDAPLIATIPVTTATEDTPYTYDVDATDTDASDTLTYSLDAAPAGMTIDATGVISWTPDNAQVGDHSVTVRVTDLAGAPATQMFTVTVAV